MRKLFIPLFILLFLIFPAASLAAGTVTQALTRVSATVYTIVYTWTGDAADGTVPATASNWPIEGYVFLVVTNPGGTAPTDNYDITLTDADAVDVMGGELANRDQTNSEQAVPAVGSGVYGARWVSGTLTLNITNQNVVSATGTVTVYIAR